MRKYLFLVIIFGLTSYHTVHAQNTNNIKIGINAGLNYPDIRGNEYAKYNNFKVGYLFGLSFDYYLNQNLSLKSNINYERKIKKFQLTYFNYDAEQIGKENLREIIEYINIPILLKYQFFNSHVFINGGPFVNIFLNEKFKPEYPNENSNEYTERNKLDFGISAGVGTNISLNEKNDLTIEIRNDFGIIDIGGVPQSVDGEVKTNAIKLVVGWNLGI